MKKLFALFAVALISVCAFAQDFTEVKEAKKLYGKWEGSIDFPVELVSQMLGNQDTKGHDISINAPVEFNFKKGPDKDTTHTKMSMSIIAKVYKADGLDEDVRDELLDMCGEGMMFADYELSKDGKTLLLKSEKQEEEDDVSNDELLEQTILMSKDGKTIKIEIPDSGMTIILKKK